MDAAAKPVPADAAPEHGVSYRDALRVWLRIALGSFGGPAGQIAVMHRILVEEKRWVSEARFLQGPSSTTTGAPAIGTTDAITPARDGELGATAPIWPGLRSAAAKVFKRPAGLLDPFGNSPGTGCPGSVVRVRSATAVVSARNPSSRWASSRLPAGHPSAASDRSTRRTSDMRLETVVIPLARSQSRNSSSLTPLPRGSPNCLR